MDAKNTQRATSELKELRIMKETGYQMSAEINCRGRKRDGIKELFPSEEIPP